MLCNIAYLEVAIADAKQEGLLAVEDPNAAAQQVYSFVVGTLLQAKIQNDVEVLHNLEPTVMAIIGGQDAGSCLELQFPAIVNMKADDAKFSVVVKDAVKADQQLLT